MSDTAVATKAVATVTPKKPVTSRRGVTVAQPKPAEVLSFDEQILRAAGDKRIDVAKLRELTDLRRQLRIEAAEEAFNEAMVACQAEMRPIEADAENDSTHSKYATLYAVDKALRPIYSAHGFSLSFDTVDCPLPNHTRVVCYVSRGAFTRRHQYDVAITTKGPKGNDVMTPTHAGGSGLSYGKRYLELMIFHVTIGDPGLSARATDDDGNAAGTGEGFPGDNPMRLNLAQIEQLRILLKKVGCSEANFLRHVKCDRIEAVLAANYERSVNLINSYRGPQQ